MSKKHEFKERVFIQCATVHPSKISMYVKEIEGRRESKARLSNQVNLEDTEHEGRLSKKAAKRLELAIQWMLYISKPKRAFNADTGKNFSFKLNFITLTLPTPQQHTDEEIKQVCLKSFIDRFSKSHGLSHYIWRAEAQANGNIHFHITTNVFIHYKEVNRVWNECVEKLGYISEFEKKWKHREPNSTDIHAVKHTDKLAGYLSKYMAKNRAFVCIGELRNIKGEVREVLYGSREYKAEEGNKKQGKVIGHVLGGRVRNVTGRLWFCSRSLSKCKGIKVNEEIFDFKALDDVIVKGNLREFRAEHVVMYFGDIVKCSEVYSRELYREFVRIREANN